jgi:hypothetical protein
VTKKLPLSIISSPIGVTFSSFGTKLIGNPCASSATRKREEGKDMTERVYLRETLNNAKIVSRELGPIRDLPSAVNRIDQLENLLFLLADIVEKGLDE